METNYRKATSSIRQSTLLHFGNTEANPYQRFEGTFLFFAVCYLSEFLGCIRVHLLLLFDLLLET
jgi:hypothetical protein